MRKMLVICASLMLLLSGCANGTSEDQTIYIAAASDLTHALTEIGEGFTDKTGVKVEFTFGSTGLLTQQIKKGAPFDLFAAAHESYIEDLIETGAVIPDSKEYYAIGRLVMMGKSEKLDKEYLLSSEVKTITIANPEHAPYGKAAKEALQTWGIWEEIQPKLVFAENIRQAYQQVESGNADVGIVALALMPGSDFPHELIDDSTHEPIVQALGIPSQTEKEESSRKFSEYMLSEEGQEVLRKYGFDLP
ncbi:molybdate ABC transporter substrate-binding protein [Bacillus sp. FJAT-27251]|uniref:molybdate ABC transporter substrate-binding protein n=1 Tax=Bacillus sp. FJAT-27251 TaxID=1684142 RepID=UPI000840E8D5|nr:molybdate ABC transporter substrate-binding protein [Bacillus sp. FJAT-27251]